MTPPISNLVPSITVDEITLALEVMIGVQNNTFTIDDVPMPKVKIAGETYELNATNPLNRMMLAIKHTFGQERFMPIMQRLVALMRIYGDDRLMPYCNQHGAIQTCLVTAACDQPLVNGCLTFDMAALAKRLPCPRCAGPMAFRDDGRVQFDFTARDARQEYCLHCGAAKIL